MKEVGILMFIFGVCILICGLYLYTGHKNPVLLWKVHDIEKFTIEETKNVGKWTMISSIIPFLIAIISYLLN